MKICLADDGFWKRKPCNKECIYFDTCSVKDNKEREAELKEQQKYYKTTNRHDNGELRIMQDYSLERKIQLSCERIMAWYEWWDSNIVVFESGGKDSRVLVHLVREVLRLTDVPIVFINTGLEYDSVREMGTKLADTVLKPEMSFVQVLTKYGYPIASKEVAQAIYECQKARFDGRELPSYRVEKLKGTYIDPKTGELSNYNMEKWGFLLDAPFRISHRCCNVMKKNVSHKYERETNRKPILGTMASESRLRTQKWIKYGCNAFYNDRPTSSPLSFWRETDILEYIHTYNLDIPDVYGEIVKDYKDGQYELFDKDVPYTTTGVDRTGCVFCLFSIGQDPEKLLKLKELEPKKYDYVMRGGKFDDKGMWIPYQGLGYKFVVDWINAHSDLNIKY